MVHRNKYKQWEMSRFIDQRLFLKRLKNCIHEKLLSNEVDLICY